jgi:hypothetical protein
MVGASMTIADWKWVALVASVAACGHSSGSGATGDASTAGGDVAPNGDGGISGNAYDVDGPISYTMQTTQLTAAGHTFNTTVWLPGSPGKHPAVNISCGSSQTAAGYAPYAQRLASYGIAVFLEDDPGVLTNTGDVLPNPIYVVDTYIPTMFADSIDTTKIGLAGHSRGGAVSLLVAEHELAGKVVAWFGLDPVDNEFGQAPREYARTDLHAIGIPTAFLGAQIASNCAPAADSYPTLYPLAPSPSTLIVGVGAGHTELEPASACSLCSICSPSGTADPDVVLAYATRYLTAFFAHELLGDSSVGVDFAGAGAGGDVAAGLVTITSR